MTDMRNCKKCGRLFSYNGVTNVCINCFEQEEAEFGRIRVFLQHHPFAKIFEVSTNLDIPVSRLKRYLREGRLEIVEKTNHFLDCEICGKPIQSGKYCDFCYKQANHDFKVVYTGHVLQKNSKRINYVSSKETKLKRTAYR